MRDPNEKKSSQYRMPLELHERLIRAAKINGRSGNSELVARIKESFEQEERIDLVQRMNHLTSALHKQQQREAKLIHQLITAMLDETLLNTPQGRAKLIQQLKILLE